MSGNRIVIRRRMADVNCRSQRRQKRKTEAEELGVAVPRRNPGLLFIPPQNVRRELTFTEETDFVRERVSEAAAKSSSGQNSKRELTLAEETDFVRERVSEAAAKSSSGQNNKRELTLAEENAWRGQRAGRSWIFLRWLSPF
ncbi:MAG: hypothetical protein IJI21_07805 [Clostridia bacterium]|nr:hypothetical protein [Clostridia bacterium]